MSKLHKAEITAIAMCLLFLSACRPRQLPTPSIQVDMLHVKPRIAVKVTGKGWQPGEQVVIGLKTPNALPKDSEPVTTALTDASGNFVALFPFPAKERWEHTAEIEVVAHTRDFSRTAIANLSYAQLATATPSPAVIVSATPWSAPALYVLGYVKDISLSARVIMVKPIGTQIEAIALVEKTQIIRDGQPMQLTDLHRGDLIEASGQAGTNNSIIADYVRVLVQAEAQMTTTPTKPSFVWRGEYYNNMVFSGKPSLVRDDPVIDFQWESGTASETLPVDNFAVRWTGIWPFETGVYRFYAQVDDGVRMWLDDHLIIDQWHESMGMLYRSDAYLNANLHFVKVEYFDARDNAHAKVWWEYRGPEAMQTYPDWKGEYYSNMALQGTPFLIVNECLLDFNWGTGAPASGMPDDNFSARWTRTADLEAGNYRFYVYVDDGVRLWVDETMLINHWQDGAAETYFGDLYLSRGTHRLRVEYYEHTGQAVIKLWWELLPATPTSTPLQAPIHTPLPPTPTPLLPPTITLTPPATSNPGPPFTSL